MCSSSSACATGSALVWTGRADQLWDQHALSIEEVADVDTLADGHVVAIDLDGVALAMEGLKGAGVVVLVARGFISSVAIYYGAVPLRRGDFLWDAHPDGAE
jgi:hypothetical protein